VEGKAGGGPAPGVSGRGSGKGGAGSPSAARRGDGLRGAGLGVLAGLLAGALLPPTSPLPLDWDRGGRVDLPIPSPGVIWEGAPPATGEDWAAVEEAAALGPFHLAPARLHASFPAPALVLTPPLRLRTGRISPLGVEVRVPVEGEETVVLEDPAGGLDTLRLEGGSRGVARGGLALRPGTEGWQRWRVGVRGAEGETEWRPWEGYALPRRPLRILALSGPPTPEFAPALRALEASDEEVDAWVHLGRDVWSGREGGLPGDPEGYAGRDLILLFPGTPLSPSGIDALLEAVEDGAGLLVVDGAGEGTGLLARAGLATGWGERRSLSGQDLEWVLPPTLAPLPSAELDLQVGTLEGEGHPWLRLGALGRGRVAATGLAESWRWRLERGEVEAHRAWWSGWADWLTDGIGPLPVLEVEGGEGRPGVPLRIRWAGASPSPHPVRISVETGDGGVEGGILLEPIPGWGGEGGLARGGLVRTRPGGVLLREEDSRDLLPGEMVAVPVPGPDVRDADPGLRLARAALASPGGGVGEAAATGGGRLEGLLREPGWPGFLLLSALAGAAWALHRLGEERGGGVGT
jgi:hypothetical protein